MTDDIGPEWLDDLREGAELDFIVVPAGMQRIEI